MHHSTSAAGVDAPEIEAETGARARYVESIGVFEEMLGALKARAADTPERRALDGLDAVLALVEPLDGKRGGLDIAGFSAFRASVEALHGRSPEVRALALFQSAFKELMAAGGEFDDLPDAEEDAEEETAQAEAETDADADAEAPASGDMHEDEVASGGDESVEEETSTRAEPETEADSEDAPDDEAAADEPPAGEALPDSAETEAADPEADGEQIAAAEPEVEIESIDVRQRIAALESELAAARAELAA